MPRAHMVSIAPVAKLIDEMNKTGRELTALYEFLKGMREGGLDSVGPKFTKDRLKALRHLILDMQGVCKPVKDLVIDLRDSGHFSRGSKIVPIQIIA